MTYTLAYTEDLKHPNTVAYLSDIKREVDASFNELVPLLNSIRENQLKLISMLTPVFGSVSGRGSGSIDSISSTTTEETHIKL